MNITNIRSSRERNKIIAVLAWALQLAGCWWYTSVNGLTPSQTMQILINFVSKAHMDF